MVKLTESTLMWSHAHSAITMEKVEKHQDRTEIMQLIDGPLCSTLDRFINDSDPLALEIGKLDNEALNLKQVMVQDDRNHFVKAVEN